MKNKIQKYLSGEREGFSLVELIIVIAIMAILIGIIALAVIPYLEKSRVSKDQQTIDSVYGAFQSAVAECQVTGGKTVTLGGNTDLTDKVALKTLENLGCPDSDKRGTSVTNKLESKKAKAGSGETGAGTIVCTLTDDGKITVVAGGDSTIKSSNRTE